MYLDIFDPKAAPRAIGIDLGTTNSIVAVVTDERPQALVTCDGTALLPSVVYYAEHGAVLVGRAANAHRSREPQKTIASVKRLMGRSMAEAGALELSTVVLDSSAVSDSVVRLDVGGKVVTPIEVSAEILKSLKKSAEDQLTNVGGAVITVPAHFDDAQRQATRDAGRLAGLEVLRLLNEPTAAALAYGLGERTSGTFAVYDLGGGTFDITVLELIDGVFQVKSTGGDTQLGGDDIDRALGRVLLGKMGFEDQAPVDAAVVSLALETAKTIKQGLSEVERGQWTILRRGGGEMLVSFGREDLEAVSRPFLERTERVVRRALRDAELSLDALDGVILVGGSTKMPAVQKFVRELFSREPLCSIDPELVVAYGAALQAAALSGEGEDVLLLDVLPLSLGIETMGGAVDKILPRNTTIPAGARATFTTYADNQTGFELHVVQGERELAKDCRSLGRFSLKGIPPMPAGLARLEVHFNVDENNILEVTATEQVTGQTQKIEVKPSYGLSEDDIEDMLIDALEHGEEDLEARRLLDAKVEAERVLLATRKSLAEDAALLVEEEGPRIEHAVAELEGALVRLNQGTSTVRPGQLQMLLDALAAATHEFAGRRMNHAIQRALSGREVVSVAPTVDAARGVDAHVAEHERNRSRNQPS